MEPIRLQKYLAMHLPYSRRQAEALIEGGKVFVDGKAAILGTKVSGEEKISVEGRLLQPQEAKESTILALYKPCGYVTTKKRTDREKQIVYDLLPEKYQHLFPIGRLDKESSGLLLFTDDGLLAEKLMHPKYEHRKTYEVLLQSPVTTKQLEAFRNMRILGQAILPPEVERLSATRLRITLQEGKNRQIRRMLRNIGSGVKKLRRISIENLSLEELGIREGQWKVLPKNALNFQV